MATQQQKTSTTLDNENFTTFELKIERYSDKEQKLEPSKFTLNWSDFENETTTVFDAVTYGEKIGLGYLSAFYGYSTGWSINSAGGWGPGEGYLWDIYIDSKKMSSNQNLEGIAISKKAGNKVIEFKRVKNENI